MWGFFEEVGWPGFALRRLSRRRYLSGVGPRCPLGPCGICLVISDPTRQRPPAQFLIWALLLSDILSWLYNSTDGSLPIVIVCHAAIDTAGRFMLPEFAGAGYQVVWRFMVGLYALVGIVVVIAAAPKRLVTDTPRRGLQD